MSKTAGIREAPTSFKGILKQLGPGLIVTGSIVGSGELIATTLTGAKAGFWLMWLIIIGCVIKVFAQLEIGKFTISTSRTSLQGLSMIPGPKPMGVHWFVWLWLITFVIAWGQFGGIVAAVGQAFSISAPLTEQGRVYNEAADALISQKVAMVSQLDPAAAGIETAEALPAAGPDVAIWAFLVALITSYLLYKGSYKLIEKIVVGLVASFTLLAIVNFVMLQFNATWAISWSEIGAGLSFNLPPGDSGRASLYTALATFGIIGVGAGELIFYPYWCLEKGYAKYIGPKDDSEEWGNRAKGWMRVMRWDAWLSMVVYTFSTVVFYLLGATVLHRAGLVPEGNELIRTLSSMFEPVFGQYAVGLFLVGAIFVLYSTFLVGMGSNALVFADVVEIFSRHRGGSWSRHKVRPWVGLALPLLSFSMLLLFPEPTTLILLAGASLTLLLPVLAFSAVYFRYKFSDERLHTGLLWDIGLWISSVALFGVGIWLVLTVLVPRIAALF